MQERLGIGIVPFSIVEKILSHQSPFIQDDMPFSAKNGPGYCQQVVRGRYIFCSESRPVVNITSESTEMLKCFRTLASWYILNGFLPSNRLPSDEDLVRVLVHLGRIPPDTLPPFGKAASPAAPLLNLSLEDIAHYIASTAGADCVMMTFDHVSCANGKLATALFRHFVSVGSPVIGKTIDGIVLLLGYAGRDPCGQSVGDVYPDGYACILSPSLQVVPEETAQGEYLTRASWLNLGDLAPDTCTITILLPQRPALLLSG
jgi:hypothetical protein